MKAKIVDFFKIYVTGTGFLTFKGTAKHDILL